MIYADFESILVREEIGEQIPNESDTKQYHKHVACSFGYKLVCLDHKFSRPFKSKLDENTYTVYDFLSSMIEESKYYSDVMKKHFNK